MLKFLVQMIQSSQSHRRHILNCQVTLGSGPGTIPRVRSIWCTTRSSETAQRQYACIRHDLWRVWTRGRGHGFVSERVGGQDARHRSVRLFAWKMRHAWRRHCGEIAIAIRAFRRGTRLWVQCLGSRGEHLPRGRAQRSLPAQGATGSRLCARTCGCTCACLVLPEGSSRRNIGAVDHVALHCGFGWGSGHGRDGSREHSPSWLFVRCRCRLSSLFPDLVFFECLAVVVGLGIAIVRILLIGTREIILLVQGKRSSSYSLESGSTSQELFRMSQLFETGCADSTVRNTTSESRCNSREVQSRRLAWLAILIVGFDGRVVKWQGVGGMSVAKDTSAVSAMMLACSQVEFDLT